MRIWSHKIYVIRLLYYLPMEMTKRIDVVLNSQYEELMDKYEKLRAEFRRMEKLIELLNEYENMDNWENLHQVEFRESKIISKKYWFIKWLVENDKIDFNKRPELYTFKAETETRWLNNMVDGSWHYESLLMLLAIQDNPIEFLVSILK